MSESKASGSSEVPFYRRRIRIGLFVNISHNCSVMRSYDINVTPDKRKPFLHHEDAILEVLEEVLPLITNLSVEACWTNALDLNGTCYEFAYWL